MVKGLYQSLPTEDPNETVVAGSSQAGSRSPKKEILYFLLKSLAISLPLVFLLTTLSSIANSHSKQCNTPHRRKEWRDSSIVERKQYLDAVLCLMETPSAWNSGTSRYDDFVYVHSKTSQNTHYAAAFLAWHRLYIHSYEKSLREQCGYEGHLMYWDWTRDSNDLSASPVWNTTSGFGSNGDSDGCIIDGPFAGFTRYYNAHGKGHAQTITLEPHCAQRNFSSGHRKSQLEELITSEYIERTLAQTTYEEFFKVFEEGAHNAIPQFVRGDFLTFTAPNDPVFFLHHTQVDRLWWIWQQRAPEARLHDFSGPQTDFRKGGQGLSTVNDPLPMLGLTNDRMVKDVMSTESSLLCYQYDS